VQAAASSRKLALIVVTIEVAQRFGNQAIRGHPPFFESTDANAAAVVGASERPTVHYAAALRLHGVHGHHQIGKVAHETLRNACNGVAPNGGSTIVDAERSVHGKKCGHAGRVLAAPRGGITRGEITHVCKNSVVSDNPAIVWFSLDLRLADNPALERARVRNAPILPVFIWAPEEEGPWPPGAASQWWLHQSLQELSASLAKRGSKLIVRRGPTAETLLALAAEVGAKSIFWNRRYEPAAIAREAEVARRLRERGIAAESCPGNLLFEPGTILNSSGKPYQVFTSFWRACQAMPAPRKPTPPSKRLRAPEKWPRSLAISALGLEPKVDWAGGLRQAWQPGEAGAAKQMKAFLRGPVTSYSTERDRPDHSGTSRLSPHLHFGEISARQVWHEARHAEPYLRQIAWREFSYHLLFHFPQTPREPLRPQFRNFPWRMDAKGLAAWTRGQTGYPLVDAGMRELWHTGWMHNRVRMLAASFLVKHLLIPWQEGAAWFWDTLVDADLANNTMGWQWSAGCGADAAPYFRIFNPVIQGEKFDPDGDYVRRWVPELAHIPNRWIHRPWEAPALKLGKTYPRPIVDHDFARKRALAALAGMKR
jgi:deoxyribodipyrimidine photo-lyase